MAQRNIRKQKWLRIVRAKSLFLSGLLAFFFGCFESEIQQNPTPTPTPYLVPNGSWIGAIATAKNSFTTGGFFTSSSGNGLFSFPLTPSVDTVKGFLYVPDPANNQVVKLTLSSGAFSGALGNVLSNSGNCPSSGVPATWCTGGLFTVGSNDGMFSAPGGIAVDLSKNYFYIADSQNYRVLKYNLNTGAFVGAVGVLSGSTGTCAASGAAAGWCSGGRFVSSASDGGFSSQTLLALDIVRSGLYVIDVGNNRIEVFNLTTGAFAGAIGALNSSTGTCPATGAASAWCSGGSFTADSIDGALSAPAGAAVNVTAGRLYVADSANNRVSAFNVSTGAFLGSIGKVTASSGTCPASGVTTGWCTNGTFAAGLTDGAFSNPKAVALDATRGLLFVADAGNHRVQRFNMTTGAFTGAIGYALGTSTGTCPSSTTSTGWCTGGVFASGSYDGMLNTPSGLIADSTNNSLYVGDSGNGRISKYTITTGAYVGATGGTLASVNGWTQSSSKVRPAVAVGAGGGDGTFSFPNDNAVDSVNGSLLVADTGNHRIQKFSVLRGILVGSIGLTTASSGTCPANAVTTAWCTGGAFAKGAGDGMLSGPLSIKVDVADGVFFVSDSGNHRISKFSLSSGAFIGAIGRVTASTGTCPSSGVTTGWCSGGTFASGAGDGMFNSPNGIDIDAVNGFLYVADKGNARILKFNLTTGAFIGAVGRVTATVGTCPVSGATTAWCTGGTFASGTTDGMLSSPTGVTLDSVNSVFYVVDNGNHRIQKFSQATGAFVGALGHVTSTTGSCPSSGASAAWCTGGTFAAGTGDGMFSSPTYAVVDVKNHFFYIADSGNSRIVQYNLASGAFIGALGAVSATTGTCPSRGAATTWCSGGTFIKGMADMMFNLPSGLAVDSSTGYLYIADPNNGRINVVRP